MRGQRRGDEGVRIERRSREERGIEGERGWRRREGDEDDDAAAIAADAEDAVEDGCCAAWLLGAVAAAILLLYACLSIWVRYERLGVA